MNKKRGITRYFSQSISIVVATILLSPVIISLSGNVFGLSTSITSMIILGLIAALLMLYALSKPEIKIKLPAILIAAFLLLVFIFTKIFFHDVDYSILQFGFYVLLPLLVSQQDYSMELMLRVLSYSSIPLVFFAEKLLVPQNVGLNQADMYVTYGFVPIILGSFTHLLFFTPKKKGFKTHLVRNIIIIISYLLCAFLCVKVTKTAVRGYWLVLLIFISASITMKIQKSCKKVTYYISLIPIILLTGLAAINISSVASFIVKTADGFVQIFKPNNTAKIEKKDSDAKKDADETEGVEQEVVEPEQEESTVSILIKTKRLSAKGDLLNGRTKIWSESIRFIGGSPLIGNGIESMERLSNGEYPYPHNFTLQLIQDCGILAISIVAVILFGIYTLFKYGFKESKIMLFFFFAIIIPIVIISGDIWKMSSFWLFAGICVKIVTEKIYGKNKD